MAAKYSDIRGYCISLLIISGNYTSYNQSFKSTNTFTRHKKKWVSLKLFNLHTCRKSNHDIMDICFFLFHNNIRQLRDVCIFEVNGMDMYKPILDV